MEIKITKVLKTVTREELQEELITVLRGIGRFIGVKAPASLNKEDLIQAILDIQDGKVKPIVNDKVGAPPKKVDINRFLAEDFNYFDYVKESKNQYWELHDSNPAYDLFTAYGVFECHNDGYGFIRIDNYAISYKDVFVAPDVIRKYNLRTGDYIKGQAIVKKQGERPTLHDISYINDIEPKYYENRLHFGALKPDYPTDPIKLENPEIKANDTLRMIDLITPLGLGQRALIVAPPKTGKTTILRNIAQAIEKKYSDVKLIVLLIDERPEEVTDFQRQVKSEVAFSTFDQTPNHHIKTAELVLNRAKRLVEVGQNVVILMDSLTRLARAYNMTTESSGKTLTGGLDTNAMQSPKHFFGAARNVIFGGSLTIIATALIDTGSKLDDVIYEEFKGTGNMEIHLSRALAEKRTFPAIDIFKSGTRKEEELLDEHEQKSINQLRKFLYNKSDATDVLLEMISKTKSNKELLTKIDNFKKLYNSVNEISKK